MTASMVQVPKYVYWIWNALLLPGEEDYLPNYILMWCGISRTHTAYWKGWCFRNMLMPSKYERHKGIWSVSHTHTHTHTHIWKVFMLNPLPFHWGLISKNALLPFFWNYLLWTLSVTTYQCGLDKQAAKFSVPAVSMLITIISLSHPGKMHCQD